MSTLWEDPHPGEKLEIPSGGSAGSYTCSQNVDGDVTGGVAVKARGAYQNNESCTVGRDVRCRRRSTKPKPVKIPARVVEEPDTKGGPVVMPQPRGFVKRPLHLLRSPGSFHSFNYETDTETEASAETGTPVSDAETDQSEITIGRASLSNFSNCLGISQEDDDTSLTVVDSDAYARASNVDDAYGWEAELERKMKCRVSTDSVCSYRHHNQQYRNSDSGMRGLLHRVFSASGRRVNSGF
ncbi:uncharacterized protein F4812DRAFT_456104 [Daldinia caldariorum]|uniref:uncharacterized protein n=1 Tax=Daldinia caldariorum TaxID=326644 RepID=UPI002008A0AA|nr:uncharacterized protein F4812DRAFT_456104 [Daldinia caldariorum]KAI1472003.1 hypothetical protein F4812DRAFT_456104 [Daldinia caldariorum]